MRPAAAAVGVTVLLAVGGPTAAATPAAVPDNATTLAVSPTSLPPRAVLSLSGFSDCAVVDGHLVFTRYDGTADNIVVRAPTATRYDDAREKYPFAVKVVVPARARPGSVRVYAEPFCGPPEEYPPSPNVRVTVTPGALAVSVSPRRPAAGSRVQLTADTCNGPGRRLTFAVAAAGRSERYLAAVDDRGRASAFAVVPGGTDRVVVSLPAAKSECPGSRYRGDRVQPVRPGPAAAPTASAVVSTAPVPSALPSQTSASPAVSTAPAVTPRADPRPAKSSRSPVVPLLAALASVTLAALVAVGVRRRRSTG